MERLEFVRRILDLLSTWSKNTYNEKYAEKIYFEIYEPVINKLLPFMKNYDGSEDDDFVNALRDCQTILIQNSALSNPVYIKRIGKILNSDTKCKKCPSFSKQRQAKCQTKHEKKNKKRRKDVFEFLINDLITEYNLLRKKIGLRKLTILQRAYLDQIAYNECRDNLIIILITIIVMLLAVFAICLF